MVATSFDLSAIKTDALNAKGAFRDLIGVYSEAEVDALIAAIELLPGPPGSAGANGAQGPAGPNVVSGSTATALIGLLYGNGTNVAVASSANVVSTLGYTPVNRAGDTLTGDILIRSGVAFADNRISLESVGSALGRRWDIISAGGIGDHFSGYLAFRDNLTGTSPLMIGRTGEVGIGHPTTVQLVSGVRLDVRGPNRTPTATVLGLVHIGTNNPAGTDIGAALTLGGFRDVGASSPRVFASLAGRKENATDLNQAGYFSLGVNNNGTLVEQFRISSSGAASLNGITRSGVFTVATLPSASANPGFEAVVTDSSVTTNGSPVVGGGSNRVKVFSNGVNWIVMVA